MKISLKYKLLLTVISLPVLLLSILLLTSTQVLAHAGHLVNENVHGILHVEHIMALVALGVVVYVVHVIRNK